MSDKSDFLDAVFSAAIEIPSREERDDFVQRQCGGDDRLVRRAKALVDAHFRAGNFLESPTEIFPTAVDLNMPECPGTAIGRYRLLEQIGEGGFAVVFMAEQEEPVRRRVAVKIIKAGMDTRQVVARFEAERQALAMMDHPNIAKVFDGGATHSGRPYFVMELVKGIPITAYCDEHQFTIDQRLMLFEQVCQAVQHAHQKGVIHRDLKPTNVLVSTHDDRPVAKVIDFGIAKATESRLTDKTLFTDFRQLIGTPAYMSPEQADGSLDVDTRTDVYSLGVLLYELLTGSPPFDPGELRSKAINEMQRIIREVEPPTPSLRLASTASSESVSPQRRIDLVRLKKLVRGELDWIVMKCLEKDRVRRYATANEVSADVARFLANEPISAQPPTRAYRLQKFVQRNKIGVLAASAVLAAVLVGLLLAVMGFVRAQHEATRSEQVARLLKDMLAAAGPSVAQGRDATVFRELLDRTAERVATELLGQPEIQGDMWYTLGVTYADIGDHLRAIELLQQSVDSYRAAGGGDTTKLALALSRLGRSQSFVGDVGEGVTHTQAAVDVARRCGDPSVLASCLFDAGRSFEESAMITRMSEPYVREALGIWRAEGGNPSEVAACMGWLAMVVLSDDRPAEAEPLAREALALNLEHRAENHPQALSSRFTLGQVLLRQDKRVEAEQVLLKTFELYRSTYDPKHAYRNIVWQALAQAMELQGRGDEAIALMQQEIEASPDDARLRNRLGRFYAARQDWRSAIEHLQRSFDMNPGDEFTCYSLALAYLETGRDEDYAKVIRDYLKIVAQRADFSSSIDASIAALIRPVEGPDFDYACKLADYHADTVQRERWVPRAQLSRALADLRRREYASAAAWAERTRTSSPTAAFEAAAWLIEAIAGAKLGNWNAAQAALDAGIKGANPQLTTSYPFGIWEDASIANRLRAEAASLLEPTASEDGKQPAAD